MSGKKTNKKQVLFALSFTNYVVWDKKPPSAILAKGGFIGGRRPKKGIYYLLELMFSHWALVM